ncbi:MAG TPA: pyridoxamine 5'-phosphate oxidase [Gemmataceae bacterium]|nr:pyridoxamine 5'-phosphate oxidase [Gemmataceae bacterium]
MSLSKAPVPRSLHEADMDPDPLRHFRVWLDQARAFGLPQPDAMTLATATPDGRPAARVVLLRGFDERGFVFFTNYESRKGQELAANPRACLVFYWAELERQVRIEGHVERVTPRESDEYFATRPRDSRLSAWASPQSQVIPSREVLERRMAELQAAYEGSDVPRPPHWGGYRVVPTSIEFWQGRASRLHDRLRYVRLDAGGWLLQRLAP